MQEFSPVSAIDNQSTISFCLTSRQNMEAYFTNGMVLVVTCNIQDEDGNPYKFNTPGDLYEFILHKFNGVG